MPLGLRSPHRQLGGGRGRPPWRTDGARPRRSIVYLEIDNRQCVQSSSQCFQSTTDVAAFLGALASLGSLNIPYKIEAVQSEWPPWAPRAGGIRPRRAKSPFAPGTHWLFVSLATHGCACAIQSSFREHFFRYFLPGVPSLP